MEHTVSAGEIADFLGEKLEGSKDLMISQPATLANLEPNSVVFIKSEKNDGLHALASATDILALVPDGFDGSIVDLPGCAALTYETPIQRWQVRHANARMPK